MRQGRRVWAGWEGVSSGVARRRVEPHRSRRPRYPDIGNASPPHRNTVVMTRTLVLVPTDLERRLLEPVLAEGMRSGDRLDLCGFGPVAAAARTARLVATHAPARVLLVGIAGRLGERLALGDAYRF
ncbi:MAG TPA: hypothetical protein DC048_04670, partial [Planctomycetaceae bacterium]|nr:hypothetical protein [Planctomycetaceae bacterium]